MNNDTLSEREFELVNIVGTKIATNQRDLSRHMDLSLGMTNMLVRRLISKGYIRIKPLNKRKVKYILTPKGFSEKIIGKFCLQQIICSIQALNKIIFIFNIPYYDENHQSNYKNS